MSSRISQAPPILMVKNDFIIFDKNPTLINLPWTYTSNNTKTWMRSVIHFSVTCTCKIIERKLLKHESIGNWFNKPWSIHNMEYYIAVKNKISMNLHSMTHRSTIKNIRLYKLYATSCVRNRNIRNIFQSTSIKRITGAPTGK